jgi:methyltransferase (TIGR00027 family)
MHVQLDAQPHVLQDEIGLRLAAPDDGWRQRPDMDPRATSRVRATIVARARYVEDLVTEQAGLGVGQYVILGAGLDTFAQRNPEVASTLRVFEVDRPGAQVWKQHRLVELGFTIPRWLRFVSVDFEVDRSLWAGLAAAGFDERRPAVVASTGVSMYLTKDASAATLHQVARLAAGCTFVTTFQLPLELVEEDERPLREATENGARAAGTPFINFFTPSELVALAREAGFKDARHVSARSLADRYFSGRVDGLRPSSSEELLVAST